MNKYDMTYADLLEHCEIPEDEHHLYDRLTLLEMYEDTEVE